MITLLIVGRFLGRPYRSRPMPKEILSSVCPLSWRACIVHKRLNPSGQILAWVLLRTKTAPH